MLCLSSVVLYALENLAVTATFFLYLNLHAELSRLSKYVYDCPLQGCRAYRVFVHGAENVMKKLDRLPL